mgnify:FL=1
MRKHILMIACMALMLAACGNPSKMAKLAEMVNTECTPEVLEAVNGKIAAQYTVEFPAKYFLSEAILDVTPVMVYAGGEVAGPVFTLQGDKVMDNNNVISYKNGGKASRTVVFDYKPGMEKAVLELRATVYNSSKTRKFEFPINYRIADGTNCTYMLVKLEGAPSMEADNYQKIIRETKESQILYTINQSNVRNNQLKSEQMKEYQEFLTAADKDERRTIVSNDIKPSLL